MVFIEHWETLITVHLVSTWIRPSCLQRCASPVFTNCSDPYKQLSRSLDVLFRAVKWFILNPVGLHSNLTDSSILSACKLSLDLILLKHHDFPSFFLLFNFSLYMNTSTLAIFLSLSQSSTDVQRQRRGSQKDEIIPLLEPSSALNRSLCIRSTLSQIEWAFFFTSLEYFHFLSPVPLLLYWLCVQKSREIMHEAVKRNFLAADVRLKFFDDDRSFSIAQFSIVVKSNLAVRYARQLEERCVIYGWFILFDEWDPPIVGVEFCSMNMDDSRLHLRLKHETKERKEDEQIVRFYLLSWRDNDE